jgi:hypothetical protein
VLLSDVFMGNLGETYPTSKLVVKLFAFTVDVLFAAIPPNSGSPPKPPLCLLNASLELPREIEPNPAN